MNKALGAIFVKEIVLGTLGWDGNVPINLHVLANPFLIYTTWILNPLIKDTLSNKRFSWFLIKLDTTGNYWKDTECFIGHKVSWPYYDLGPPTLSFPLGLTLSLLTAFLYFIPFSVVFHCIPAPTSKSHGLYILLLTTCRDQFQINGQEIQKELV